jgi:hypothetical protein
VQARERRRLPVDVDLLEAVGRRVLDAAKPRFRVVKR